MRRSDTQPRPKRRRPRGALLELPERLDSMREWLEERLSALPELEIRRLFGGAGLYSQGTMFGILHSQRVYLKTSEATAGEFLERGMAPFRPPSGRVLSSYHEVPGEILEDEGELLAWARRALQVAEAAAPKSRARRVAPEEILSGHAPAIVALCEQARGIVRSVAPGASEAGYPGWRLIGYRAPHYFCFVAPHADHVRVGFERGARLEDPSGLLEPMGKQVRFVRLVPGEAPRLRALRQLIRRALELAPAPRAR